MPRFAPQSCSSSAGSRQRADAPAHFVSVPRADGAAPGVSPRARTKRKSGANVVPVRKKRIVAVFGGSSKPDDLTTEEWEQALKDARRVGAMVAENQLLLTGGTRSGTSTVKGCAITGADAEPWIGVSPKRPTSRAASAKSGTHVIPTGLGDQRNYVEACLCDVVIALAGGDGTISEVTCALALQRPVLFVGKRWRDLDLKDGSVLDRMFETTLTLFDAAERADPELNKKLRATLRPCLDSPPECRYVDGFATPGAAKEAAALIQGAKLKGGFPGLTRIAEHKRPYESWIALHG